MKKYVDLKKYNIEFKNLLSGPAQIGRMINYIIYTGEGKLLHKPGNRTIKLENNIGSAWTIEFMIGLNLVKLRSLTLKSESYVLELTEIGKEIYDLLQDKGCIADIYEGNSVKELKDDLKRNKIDEIYILFEKAFRKSAVFKNLIIYLDIENCSQDNMTVSKSEFNDNFFAEMLQFYENQQLNLASRTSTGGNRVPSLVQMCEFLDYCTVTKGRIIFKKDKLLNEKKDDTSAVVSQNELIEMIKKEDMLNKRIQKLAEEFGEDGNTIVTSTARLSQVQSAFKDRLIKENGQSCVICGIKNREMLIASHIKQSSLSNIFEKADNNNGLLLCANHDKLFDRFLITFNDEDGSIIISNNLDIDDKVICGLNSNFKLPSTLLTPQRRNFLKWHNDEFFKKNK